MKGCFFLQRRFAYFGHAMALLLRERYGITDFCGYVGLRSSFDFLSSQKDIVYSKLLLEDDVYAQYKQEKLDIEYLKWLEKEYGLPNLWPYINMDRVLRYGLFLRAYPSNTPLYSHEDLLRILQITAKTIIKFFDEEKPDFTFFSTVSNLSSMLLYHIAKKKNIKTFLLYFPRIENQYAISEAYDEFRDLNDEYFKIKNKENEEVSLIQAKIFLENYQKTFDYRETTVAGGKIFKNYKDVLNLNFKFLFSKEIIKSIRWHIKAFWQYWLNPHRDDYIVIKPWHELIDKIKRRYRTLCSLADLYDNPLETEDYAYYGLHSEPEALPMLLASFYTDQLWLIKQIAHSLPVHFKLYVKEHPIMIGKRLRSYYKELKKIPNVKLINPLVLSTGLIKNSKLVLAITGTAGWEAVLLEKPVIIFSKVFYSQLLMIEICRNIEELPFLIKKQLEHFNYNEDDLISFITAVYKESVEIDITRLWHTEGSANVLGKKKAELIPVVDLLAKKLGLQPV